MKYGQFKVKNSDRYFLPGSNKDFLHLATLNSGLREFMVFSDQRTNQLYIEETSWGNLQKIEDEELWNDLAAFIQEKNLHQIK